MRVETLEDRRKLIILLVVGLLYSLGIAYVFQSVPTFRLTSDLFPRWYASKMWLTAGRSVYDWANAYEITKITGWPYANQVGYYYPAYLLLFTLPLSIFPYQVAHIIWTVFGLWCLWLGTFIIARLLKPGFSINRLTLLLLLVTISVPVLQHTQYAQFNTIGVLALALTYRSLYRKQYLLAGIWAGGLLFKPQATLLPLLFLLEWSALKRERRSFWLGLAGAGIILWAIAELFEPGWAWHFLGALHSYVPVNSVVDLVWNPYQLVSITLVLVTGLLVLRLRHYPASEVGFGGLLAWSVSLNALVIPMFGMLHMVLMAPILVLLLNGVAVLYPHFTFWMWAAVISLFIAGLVVFVIALLISGPSGVHIASAEMVYRFIMPALLGLASLSLTVAQPRHTQASLIGMGVAQ